MLSIIGGQWRGHRLKCLDREGLRPTSARVKASIFSILESIVWKRTGLPDFSHWRCLDLFAGVGGLGLEMLSRRAEHCVFVEKDRAHAKLLQQNIVSLKCEDNATLIVGDVNKVHWEKNGPFDLVLLDPPYADSLLPVLLQRLSEGDALRPGAVILFEHAPGAVQGEIPGLTLHSTRTLGPAGISVYIRNV